MGLSIFQAGPVGLTLFAIVVAAAVYVLLRHAVRLNLLAPVIAGLSVRLVVMLVAQLTSGHGGAFYLDDAGYSREAALIAHQWLEGHVINPSSYQYAGSLAFGYQTMVASIFLLTGKSMVAGKLINVLLGTTTVLLVGLLSGRLFGTSTMRRAAWLMALIPTSIWWSAVLLKESLVAALVVGAMLALLYWPRRGAVVAFVLAIGALAVTRSPAVLAVTVTALSAFGLGAIQQRRTIDFRAALTYLILACLALLVGLVAFSAGHPGTTLHQIGHILGHLGLEQHHGAAGVAAAIPKSLVSPYPWVFTQATRTWDRALYPGMWVWYALLPTAMMGVWRLRRRAEVLLFALPVGTLLAFNAFTVGYTFRQRSTIEPFLLLLVMVGADSWRWIARRAAMGYLLVALLATVQSRSPVTGGVIVLVALALELLARQLPSAPTLLISIPANLLGPIEGHTRARLGRFRLRRRTVGQ
jgi:4-amino-4-deoxy-L-arabinose transferase-like glycosyltransferase